ncbi:hypothetical protein ACLOJK_040726 [Asimina triloba]
MRRSPPHNAVATRPLSVADTPPLEDRALSNSPNPLEESLNSPIMRAKFHTSLEMMKSLQQQMIRAQPDATSILSVGVPLPLAATVLTPDMTSIIYHLQATSQLHPSSTLRAPDMNSLFALHLQMQLIPDRAFLATLDKQGKMWFSSLSSSSITSFKQLTDLFEAQFNNHQQRPIIAAQLIYVRQGPNEPLRDYMTRFNREDRKVLCLHIEVYMYALIQGIRNYELTWELGLCLIRSIYKLNEVIVHHIFIEKIEKWWVKQD